jgi:hypothetical protein
MDATSYFHLYCSGNQVDVDLIYILNMWWGRESFLVCIVAQVIVLGQFQPLQCYRVTLSDLCDIEVGIHRHGHQL